jgi:hypothetical protein
VSQKRQTLEREMVLRDWMMAWQWMAPAMNLWWREELVASK